MKNKTTEEWYQEFKRIGFDHIQAREMALKVILTQEISKSITNTFMDSEAIQGIAVCMMIVGVAWAAVYASTH